MARKGQRKTHHTRRYVMGLIRLSCMGFDIKAGQNEFAEKGADFWARINEDEIVLGDSLMGVLEKAVEKTGVPFDEFDPECYDCGRVIYDVVKWDRVLGLPRCDPDCEWGDDEDEEDESGT